MGVTVEFQSDGCALLSMRNGQNRFNLTTLKEINDALDTVERNASCRVLITTGEGKFYSNGIDLDWLRSQGEHGKDVWVQFNAQLLNTMWRVMHFPVPTVAAINGHAFAGGAFFAMCHDYRVMRSDRGWISWNETLINLRIGEELTKLLKIKLSSEAIRESTIYAKRITGPKAVTLKIADVATTEENLISECKRLGLGALGRNEISRSHLQDMKRDLFPRKKISKL